MLRLIEANAVLVTTDVLSFTGGVLFYRVVMLRYGWFTFAWLMMIMSAIVLLIAVWRCGRNIAGSHSQ